MLEYVVCCAVARYMLRAATNENLCEAKLIVNGEFEANLMAHQIWGDVVLKFCKEFNSFVFSTELAHNINV